MQIEYIAFDSFGVKSMCTLVKTKDVTITLDPGIAQETNSFPLPADEKDALDTKYRQAIKRACQKSDIIIITHYHYDHFTTDISLYENKILLIKDSKRNINKSQRRRSREFLKILGNKPRQIEFADGKTFMFGKTKIKFSKDLWHGIEGTGLGFVVMVMIDDGKERLLFTADLNGIYISKYVDLIAKEKPDYVILDGAATYLLGYIVSFRNLKKCIRNTIKLLEKTNAKLYIIDHHLLRDYRYKEIYYEAFKRAKELNKKLMTAAEAIGRKPMVIEGYEKNGPTRWKEWKKMTFKELDRIIKGARKKIK